MWANVAVGRCRRREWSVSEESIGSLKQPWAATSSWTRASQTQIKTGSAAVSTCDVQGGHGVPAVSIEPVLVGQAVQPLVGEQGVQPSAGRQVGERLSTNQLLQVLPNRSQVSLCYATEVQQKPDAFLPPSFPVPCVPRLLPSRSHAPLASLPHTPSPLLPFPRLPPCQFLVPPLYYARIGSENCARRPAAQGQAQAQGFPPHPEYP